VARGGRVRSSDGNLATPLRYGPVTRLVRYPPDPYRYVSGCMARRRGTRPAEVRYMLWDILIVLLIVCLIVFLVRRI